MFSPLTRIRKRRRAGSVRTRRFGTATVEMAMVAPVVFLLIFGSVEFARMMMVRQAITNAAREGCRHACLASTQNNGDAHTIVRERLLGIIADPMETDALRIEIEPAFATSPESGTTITASVEIDCSDVSWLPPFFTAHAKIRGTAAMDRE